jgi:hypothetical protein
MNNTKKALIWITNILKNHAISFQITGGLAARVYGSTRELIDIDIDIPENDFEKIKEEVKPFIIFGPSHFKSENWDLFLMTLNYHGQEIDLSGAENTKIYDNKNKAWVEILTDFSKVRYMDIEGLTLPVIEREALMA